MKYRHSTFIAFFLAVSLAACVALPISIVSYIDACKSGFGAELEVERASLYSSAGITILSVTFRYTSPDRLSTAPGEYWLNATTGGGTVVLSGTIDMVFDRGISDVVTVSAPLTTEQSAALADDDSITLDYWIWVDVPDRGSGSVLAGSQTVPLEGSA